VRWVLASAPVVLARAHLPFIVVLGCPSFDVVVTLSSNLMISWSEPLPKIT
jgi:hypothetical protein